MKLSQFNNSVQHNDAVVLYNSFSNQFLEVDYYKRDLIDSAKLNGNIDDLIFYDPLLYVELIEKGFVVSEEKDEIQAVKDVQAKVDLEDEYVYQLFINPTMNCNFKCWYCYESHIKGSKMTEPILGNVIKYISNVVNDMPRLKRFNISWFGGEPLLYFDKVVYPVLMAAKEIFGSRDIDFTTSFTTNGLLINEKMVEKLNLFKVSAFQITLDGNREHHDTVRFISKNKGSYDEIVQNVLLLCRNGIDVALRINYTKKNLNNIENIVEDIAPLEDQYRKHLVVSFHKVWQEVDRTLDSTIRRLRFFFKENGFQTVNGGVPNTLRQSCYADRKNHATINYNGEVFKCTARNFLSEAKEGDLKEDGTIVWNEKFHNRMSIKFKNKPCLSCPILPLCNGGCSQVAIESKGQDYCVYNFDEQRKKEIVLNKYLQYKNSFVES